MPLPLTTSWAIAISMVRTCQPKGLGYNCPSSVLKFWDISLKLVRLTCGGLKLGCQTTWSSLAKTRALSELVVQAAFFVFTTLNRRCTQIYADELQKSATLPSFCRKNSKKCDRPLPLSYFFDGKGARAFYQLPSLWADSRSDNSLSEG